MTGPIWCEKCGYRVEQKELGDCGFFVKEASDKPKCRKTMEAKLKKIVHGWEKSFSRLHASDEIIKKSMALGLIGAINEINALLKPEDRAKIILDK